MEIISDLRQFQIHRALFSLRMAMFILFGNNGKFWSKIKTVKRKRNPKRYNKKYWLLYFVDCRVA